MKGDGLEVSSFDTPSEWRHWLAQNHDKSKGIWLRFYKKASGVRAVDYDQALDEALCYGWIDGQLMTYDDQSFVRKFTPRRPKSVWSKRNIEHVERLTKAGKMTQPGLNQVEAAKADGRWDQAYDAPSTMEVPPDFLKELAKNKKAEEFFATLNKTNVYAICWRLQTAKKPETRQKRMAALLDMMAKGQKLH